MAGESDGSKSGTVDTNDVAVTAPVVTPPVAQTAFTGINLAGEWRDNAGKPIHVDQTGNVVRYEIQDGSGVILFAELSGRMVGYNYGPTPVTAAGRCVGTIAPGDAMIVFQCQAVNGYAYGFQLNRVG